MRMRTAAAWIDDIFHGLGMALTTMAGRLAGGLSWHIR